MMKNILFLAIGLVIIIGFSASHWMNQNQTPSGKRILLQDGREFSDDEVQFLTTKFSELGISTQSKKGQITIVADDRKKCQEVLRSSEFKEIGKKNNSGSSLLPRSLMTPSEQARLAEAEKIAKIKSILTNQRAVRKVEIIHDVEKSSNFKRELTHSAVVTLWPEDGHVIESNLASAARQVVQKSFVGMQLKDVLVVDGENGITFNDSDSPTNGSKVLNDLDLKSTRLSIQNRCATLLKEFDIEKIEVDVSLEQIVKSKEPESKTAPVTKKTNSFSMEVIPNGAGKIGKSKVADKGPGNSTKEPLPKRPNTPVQTEFVKRLNGIEVSIREDSVEKYLKKNLGVVREISDDQFNRGVTALRNEITKKILTWTRSNGLITPSDLVSVVIMNAPEQTADTPAITTANSANFDQYYLFGVGTLIAIFGGLLIWQKTNGKKTESDSSNRQSQSRRNMILGGADPAAENQNLVRSFPNQLAEEK